MSQCNIIAILNILRYFDILQFFQLQIMSLKENFGNIRFN